MKSFIATFAAIADATRTRLRDYDPTSYYGYDDPGYHSGEIYHAGEDPYVKYVDPMPVYDNVPVYDTVPVYDSHAHEPVYHDHHDHHHNEPVYHEPVTYDTYPEESYDLFGNIPLGNFWDQVQDFNEWEPVWEQDEYEERIQTEAELMIAIEAIREGMVDLDYEMDYLEDGIDENHRDIDRNIDGINDNDYGIEYNDHEIDEQRYRLKRLQKQCRYSQARLDEDRDFLVLYC